jgi:hypothetical protein
MRTALVSLSFVIAACSTTNPWFFVDDRPDGDSSTEPGVSSTSATSSTLTEGTGTAPTTGSPATSTTGPDPTTDATSVTSVTDASSSTQSVEPSTSTSSAGTSGVGDTSTSSGGETTAADASTGDTTGDTTDSTTGEPVVKPYYSLYELCPDKETEWLGGVDGNKVLQCVDPKTVPAAFQQPMVIGLLGSELFNVLQLAPSIEKGGAVMGTYGPFMLTDAEQQDAELFTAATCATSQAVGSCQMLASVWLGYKGQPLMQIDKPVMNGQVMTFLIKLWQIPGVNAGEPFEVILRAEVGDVAHAEDRLWFVNPRIRPPGG